MKIAIHQPQYWPWLPYMHKLLSADLFVYLDTVQFSNNGFQNRNRVKTPTGPTWLTIPIKHHQGQSIRQTTIADFRALRKHFTTLAINYAGAPGFGRWREELNELLDHPSDSLNEIAIASTEWMLEKLGGGPECVRSSQLPSFDDHGSGLIAEICKYLKADKYLAGIGSLAYMERDDFSQINCEVWVQQWESPGYNQVHPQAGHIPELSALDLLLNCPDRAAKVIQSSGDWKLHWATS